MSAPKPILKRGPSGQDGETTRTAADKDATTEGPSRSQSLTLRPTDFFVKCDCVFCHTLYFHKAIQKYHSGPKKGDRSVFATKDFDCVCRLCIPHVRTCENCMKADVEGLLPEDSKLAKEVKLSGAATYSRSPSRTPRSTGNAKCVCVTCHTLYFHEAIQEYHSGPKKGDKTVFATGDFACVCALCMSHVRTCKFCAQAGVEDLLPKDGKLAMEVRFLREFQERYEAES